MLENEENLHFASTFLGMGVIMSKEHSKKGKQNGFTKIVAKWHSKKSYQNHTTKQLEIIASCSHLVMDL